MKNEVNNSLVIMRSTLNRLPLYYSYITKLKDEGVTNVSATEIAKNLNLNPVLVRKDLASVSSVAGKPRLGFHIGVLLKDMEEYLGYNSKDEAVLVGVGSLGRLLLTNKGFKRLGIDIVAGFDKDESLYHEQINGKYIFPMEKLPILLKMRTSPHRWQLFHISWLRDKNQKSQRCKSLYHKAFRKINCFEMFFFQKKCSI